MSKKTTKRTHRTAKQDLSARSVKRRTICAVTSALGLVVSSLSFSAPSLAAPSTATEDLSSVCAVAPSQTPTSVVHAGVQGGVAGETLAFTQTVAFDEGTLFQNALRLADGSVSISSYVEFSALPSVLVVDPTTITVTLGGVDVVPIAGTGPDPAGWVLETDTSATGTTTWRAYPPGDVPAILAANTGVGVASVEIPAGGQDFVMSYTAVIPDTGYAVGEVLDGAECFATVSTGPTNRETDRTTSKIAVVEPDVQLTKNVVGLPVSNVNGIVKYRFTVQTPIVNASNDVGVSPSRDVVAVDTVPVGLTPTDQDGNTLGDGDTVPMTGTPAATGTWDATARTITTPLGDIDPGVTRGYEYKTRVAADVAPGTVLTNTLGATFSSLAGTGAFGDKDFSAPEVTADVSIAAEIPEVVKSSDIQKYAPGQPITYTIMANLPAGSSYANLTLLDTLPDGLDFGAYQTATCSGSPDCPTNITELATTTNALGETIIGWYPNLLPASATPVTITVTYTASISARYRNNTIVEYLDELTNKVALKWNNIDRFGDVIASTSATAEYDGVVDDVNTVIRDHPTLLLDKRGYVPNGGVANAGTYGWNFVDGETVTYRTVVRNTGSQPAVNVTFRDEYTQMTVDSSTVLIDGVACPTCVVTDGTGFVQIEWPGPLAVGASVTVEYVATPVGTDLRNRITITRYEDADGAPYLDAPTDAVRIVIPDPNVAITKSLLNVGGTAVSNFEGTVVPFRIRVTNISAMTAHNLTVTDTAPPNTCPQDNVRNPSRTVTNTAPGVFTIDGPLVPGASASFDTDLVICGPIALGTSTNSATVNWEDLHDNLNSAGQVYAATNTANFNVRRPELEIVKGPEADEGATVPVDAIVSDTDYFEGTWTVEVTNTGSVVAENLTLTDPMPESLEYVPGTATAVWDPVAAYTFTDNSAVPDPVDPTLVYTDTTHTLSGVLSRIDPGQSVTVSIPFRQNGEQPDDLRRDNTATISNTNLPEAPELSDDGTYYLIPAEPTPHVTKTVSVGAAGASPGVETVTTGVQGEVRYTLTVTMPEDLNLAPANVGVRDVIVRDLLPDGMSLTNEPATGVLPATGPWSITCVSGPCASAEFQGDYIGNQPVAAKPGASELFFYFGDYNDVADAVFNITFTAKSDPAFDDGTPVSDGVRDPLVNNVNVKWNRHEGRGAGANGDTIAGLATLAQANGDFDISGRQDDAKIDISSPRLDPRKDLFEDPARTVGRAEFEPGDNIYYRITMTNSGAGDAYNVEFTDDLGNTAGTNRMVIDPNSINVVQPAGVTCTLDGTTPDAMRCLFPGPLAADPDGPGNATPGGQIIVEYAATPLPSAEILSPISFDIWEPDLIRNTVDAVEYTEVANPGPLDNVFTAGQSVTRAHVFTPVPSVETNWIVNSANACPAAVGAGRDALLQVDFSNGDKYTRNSNGSPNGLVYGFDDWPTEDLDNDGILDKGGLHDPIITVTLPASVSFDPNSDVVTASGPDAPTPSADFSTYTPVPAPDSVVVNGNGTTTLVWNSLVPLIRPTPTPSVPGPTLRLRIETTTAGAGSAWAVGNLEGADGSGALSRGEDVDEHFRYDGSDANTCRPTPTGGGGGGGGGSQPAPPDHRISKTPDQADNVEVIPGEVFNFTITIHQGRTNPLTEVNFLDDMPAGLTYAGSLDPSESGYEVATIAPVPAGWTSLQDYYTDTIDTTAGRTRARWTTNMPDLPKGDYTITMPTIAAIPAENPDEFVTNRATLVADEGLRLDDGAVKTTVSTRPTVSKRVDKPSAPFSTDTDPVYFTFTSDVTIPAAFNGWDLIVTDFPNLRDPSFPLGLFGPNEAPVMEVEPGTDTVTCIAGCTGATDTLTGTRLGNAPKGDWDEGPFNADPDNRPNNQVSSRIWPDHDIRYTGPWNGMTGWYIGDITPDPEGQDRILRFTYKIKAPTVDDLYDKVVARRLNSWTEGFTGTNGEIDPVAHDRILDNVDWTRRLSQIEYTNLVQLGWQNGNRNWSPASFSNDWTAGFNPLEATHGGSRVWVSDQVDFQVEYPVLELEKSCGSADGATDRDVPNTPPNTPNTFCEITVRNTSNVDAYDVVLTEDPDDANEFYRGYTNPSNGSVVSAAGTDATATAKSLKTTTANTFDGAIERPTYEENAHLLTAQAPMLEDAEWNFDLTPGETKKFSYKLRLDGITNLPDPWFEMDNQASYVGAWDNLVTLEHFSATPGGEPVFPDHPLNATDTVTFTQPYVSVSKFPAQPERTTADLRPFNKETSQFGSGQEAWWRLPDTHIWNNPYGGGWYDQPADADGVYGPFVEDLLTPYPLRRQNLDHIWNSRGLPFIRHGDEECVRRPNDTGGWNVCGIYRAANNPADADNETIRWNLNIDNPDRWSPTLYATPTEDYRWGIDVRLDGLKNLDTISIQDRLPYGWTYKPGSAELIEAKWNIGFSGQEDINPPYDHTVVDSVARIAIPDPTVNTATQFSGACNPSNYGEAGPTLTWDFARSQTTPSPWNTLYLNAADWSRAASHETPHDPAQGFDFIPSGNTQYEAGNGSLDKWNWVRLEFTAVPGPSVLGCDPDTKDNIKPFMQENNTTVTTTSAITPGLGESVTYAMLAPVTNPVTLTKTPDNAFTSDDRIVNFEITFTNNLAVPVLDQDFVDTLVISNQDKNLPTTNPRPPGVVPTFETQSKHVCGTTTADKTFSEASCVETQTSATSTSYAITWNVPRIEPGEAVTFTIPVEVAYEERNLARINNSVTTIVDEYHDEVLTDIGDYTVVNASPPPNPVKSVTPTVATINDTVTYTIRWVAGVQMVFNDLLYTDVMPDGLELVSLGNVTCSGGCPKNPASVVKMTPEPQADGTTQLGWWFGDVAGSNRASTWTMTYTAKVLNNYKAPGNDRVEAPIDLVNTVQGASNKNNTLQSMPAGIPVGDELDDWFYPGAERTATLRVREPIIVVEKSASTPNDPARTGDIITYTVTARNTGEITAYGVNMVDTPDPRSLEGIVMAPRTATAPVGSQPVNGWTLLDPQIGWYIPQIVPNGTATFTYTAVVNENYLQAGVTEAYNDADVTAFRARPGVNPDPDDRLYTEVPNAETATPLGAPNLNTQKYVGGCAEETINTARYTGVSWCVTITNDGAVSATDVTLRDLLPIGWTYQAGSTTGTGWPVGEPATSIVNRAQLVEWTVDDIAAGATATVEFIATSDARAPLKATNSVTAVATLADGSPAPLGAPGYRSTDPADVALLTFGLEIEKVLKEQTRAQPAGTVSWNIAVRNPSTTALTGVAVVDNLPPPLAYLSSTSDDPEWAFASAGAAGSGPGGTQPVNYTISRLEPDETVNISIVVTVPPTGIAEMEWLQNEVQATANEVADPVVNTAKVRFFEGASIGDRVWRDTDNDGIQDDGETGVEGVAVHLLNGDGEQIYFDPNAGVFSTDPNDGFPPMTVQTDADGLYLFDGLPAGDYQVRFEPPEGLALTFPNRGGDPNADSNADRTTGITPTISVVGGDAVRNVDAGLIEGNNSVGDTVWIDADGDGVQDGNIAEAGLPGVTVTLYNADTGEALQTVVTDGMGNYLFDNLPDGNYEVGFELDPNNAAHGDLAPTWPNLGGDPALDSNADRTTGRSGVIDLDSAGTSTDPVVDVTVDAGFTPKAALGDRVWNDTDGDGIDNNDEAGIPGVLVELLDVNGNVLATRTTGPNGEYLFDDIPIGDYQVRFTKPDGFVGTQQNVGDSATDSNADPITGLTASISLGAGDEDLTIDAGFYIPVTVGGPMWIDTDGDGIQEDGEPPIPDMVVRLLDENGDPVLDPNGDPITTTTGPDGRFLFENLPPGQYQTAPVPPAGFVFTLTEQGIDPDADSNGPLATSQDLLGGDSDLTLGGGFYAPVSVGGPIWEDVNGDGIQDAGEPTFPDVVVSLLNDDGTPVLNANGDPVTTLTGPDGRFLFDGLPPGQYRTMHGPIPGRLPTIPFQGTDPNADSNGANAQSRDLPSGDSDLTLGSGWVRPVSVGGPIWEDVDGDGIQEDGEPPIPGLKIRLLDQNGDPVLDANGDPITTTSGADGRFLFENLPPGQYQTAPVAAPDWVFTLTEIGDDPTVDSNGPQARSQDLPPGGSDLTLGGGFVRPVAIGGPIWEDVDGDGIQDPDEPTFPGVVVSLLNDDGTPVLDVDGDPVTTITGSDGRFVFGALPPGQYRTSHGPIPGFVQTPSFQGTDPNADSNGKDAQSRDLDSGENDLTLGSGWVRPVSVGGPIWEDLDGDGIQEDGEPPIVGVTVRLLDENGDPVLDVNGDPITTTTGPDGRFLFEDLLPGVYKTVPVPPPGSVFTLTEQGTDPDADSNGPEATSTDLPPGGSDLTLGGGFYTPVSVGGPIWEDVDGDGIQDAGEPAFRGVVVSLLNNDGTPVLDADGDPITTTTGPDGRFLFEGLPPGQYRTMHGPIPGFIQTTPFQGADPNADSNGREARSRDLASGGSDLTLGSGWVRPVRVGGPIWQDTDGDGIQESGEPPIPGVTVKLRNGDGTPVLDADGKPRTTITGPDGRFEFDGLPPGTYKTVPVPPAGFVFTKTEQGDDRNTDSNGPEATSRTLQSGEDDLTLGGGFVRPVMVGGAVWEDVDRDGVMDSGEPPMVGVTIHLLHEDGSPVFGPDGTPMTVVTGPDGRYAFENLAPGRYRTHADPPTGWYLLGADAESHMLSPGSQELTMNTAFVRPAAIGGWVWEDDGTGIRTADSKPFPGLVITLLDSMGEPVRDDDGNPITTTTGPDGGYEFTGLPPGDYMTLIPVPPGYEGVAVKMPIGDQITNVRGPDGRTVARQAGTSGVREHNASFRFVPVTKPDGGGLPGTGGNSNGLLRIGFALLLLGAWLVVGVRRRRLAVAIK